MTGQDGSDATREQRLREVLVVYLEAAGRGREPQPEELFARHPDLAVELREFLANRAQLGGLAAPLRAVANPGPLLRRLRAVGRDLPRWHGRRLQSAAGQPQPPSRHQDDPQGRAGQRRVIVPTENHGAPGAMKNRHRRFAWPESTGSQKTGSGLLAARLQSCRG